MMSLGVHSKWRCWSRSWQVEWNNSKLQFSLKQLCLLPKSMYVQVK